VRFTTNAYPREQRHEAWRFALHRCSITLDSATPGNLYGELLWFKTASGIDFARVDATPQNVSIDFSDQSDLVWLLLLLRGQGSVTCHDKTAGLAEGDVIYGSDITIARLSFRSDHRCIVARVPRSLLNLHLRAQLPKEIQHLSGATGTGRILSGLLGTVADTAGELTADQLRPIEMALPEIVLMSLLDNAPTRALGGAAGARAALLQRIFQTIEMRLSDANLNIQHVANEHGVSRRYLQKLFETIESSFGQYLKLRRLERCRLDLISPLHAQKSITEILFQWGFNDSASFSRAFREQYGMSPREYRKSPPDAEGGAEDPRRGRPATARDGTQSRDFRPSIDDDEDDEDFPGDGEAPPDRSGERHHFLQATPDTVHWGYFSRFLKPALHIQSGDYVTIETLTHHANDDFERMIEGDAGAESVYEWTRTHKAVDRRGAGPMDASTFGRGAGEGFGVHICTGPISIAGAKPGDIVEVRILDLAPRPSGNPKFSGRVFGSNAAAYWGFHYNDYLTEPKQREVVTIYEIESGHGRHCAHAVYNYRWTPQTDPFGVVHNRIDYPGVPVDHDTIEKKFDILRNVEIPLRPHFGVIGMAPAHADIVDSVPPAFFGGNLDNWRLGAGAKIFLPVAVAGGLLSIGDPHASQGDSELCGTAIECSMTGVLQIILHPKPTLSGHILDLDYPLIETKDEWVILGFSHPNYLKELGDQAQSEIYKKSTVDLAMRDAFRKARRFLMTSQGLSEDEAISLLSVGVDFGVTQVVDGNWGVHAIISKSIFTA
jgi:acetamidase/formamidase/AraC-like DNA-binding protein